MTTRITIQTTSIGQRGQHYRVTDAGRVLLESTREPLFDACRALAAKGITGRLEDVASFQDLSRHDGGHHQGRRPDGC